MLTEKIALPDSGRAASSGRRLPARLLRGAVRLRRLGTVGLVLYALALGAGLGLATANWATRGRYPFGGVTLNAWTAWPKIGARDADPYVRAIHARTGEVPLALGEGLLLTALTDDSGRRLDPSCRYRIAGATPPSRAWTLTVERRGRARADAATDAAKTEGSKTDGAGDAGAPRTGFTSTEVLRDRDGRFAVTLGPVVQPGNWLPMPAGEGSIRLVLRLYDTPVAASTGVLEREGVPSITREDCP
ncbi:MULTISPECIES: DUF1214 domain-containing protein [Methylobacterium]|jgi:hypothetical protein|uniref:DUF1214 domain-containing protein n=1 Tax=Methylobacterium TaxID=407 RepID=UPI0008F0C5A3|nr:MULTISPECIES: DUF1214 domain-containing protein [Methylobacterium]MBZ6417038.1 DUF1214 domain-containing protein [Methylobacterium sp.]MBK3400351.1 DUF1214 domain-containing protein [Methylobacterium ajmalii]MBK3411917.1 DUF1214 domain-containing protein [Methylobacterium ajmalii]MBK3421792.1 DUF1214 domain-containing protein [Methylobacterium ajmalii]SFF47035.1 hypothetical protein SAMN04487844_12125 [Methylobacterium sp. yr596]